MIPSRWHRNLDVDCEMTRRCKLRNDARKIMMRDDVQEKLKKALQRKPATQDRVYVPGETVYFFVPHPIKPDHAGVTSEVLLLVERSMFVVGCSKHEAC